MVRLQHVAWLCLAFLNNNDLFNDTDCAIHDCSVVNLLNCGKKIKLHGRSTYFFIFTENIQYSGYEIGKLQYFLQSRTLAMGLDSMLDIGIWLLCCFTGPQSSVLTQK